MPNSFEENEPQLAFLDQFEPRKRFQTETDSYLIRETPRQARIRTTSLSIPSTFSSAFGLSSWETPQQEETADISAMARTIDYLGLDDPVEGGEFLPKVTAEDIENLSGIQEFKPRPRSISFPQELMGEHFFEHTRSFTIAAETNLWEDSNSLNQGLNLNCFNTNLPQRSFENISNSFSEMSGSPDAPCDNFSEALTPSRSLWVGNIESSIGKEELSRIFGQCGPLESIRVLPEKECAFINFQTVEDALAAREKFEGAKLGNTFIRIGFGKADSFFESDGTQPTKSLWIGNIPSSTKASDLEMLFRNYGQVESARVLTHKNCGFINFHDVEGAIMAKNLLNGKEVNGSVVKIGFAKVPPRIEPLSVKEAFQKPEFISGLVYGAMERLYGSTKILSRNSVNECMIKDSEIDDGGAYSGVLPALPSSSLRKVDQNRLRDYRKKLDNSSQRELDSIFYEVIDDAVDLCSGMLVFDADYIGNVVIQKLMEKCAEEQKLVLVEKISPYFASLGVHKNGTWAVQKIIDCAKTKPQIDAIVNALQPFVPALLLDQFGNYVIQCCLRLGNTRNQFIFDAMSAKCWLLGQGRFGARAMKACLESQYTTKKQQKQVSLAIVQNAARLCMNSNGAILVTWLFDSSQLPGRYRVVAPLLLPHIGTLCCHKLSAISVLKIIYQKSENDAHDILIGGIFKNNTVLTSVLKDTAVGVSTITKILTTGCANRIEKTELSNLCSEALSNIDTKDQGVYKRLWDEINGFAPTTSTDEPMVREGMAMSYNEHQECYSKRNLSPNRITQVDKPLPPRYPSKENNSKSKGLITPQQSPSYYGRYNGSL